jgi:hemerythrin-like metal-binding protein
LPYWPTAGSVSPAPVRRFILLHLRGGGAVNSRCRRFDVAGHNGGRAGIKAETSMDTFVWDERYLTGEEVVDNDHRELVRIINWVSNMQAQESTAEAIGEVLDQLVQYAVTHFGHEETLMADIGCDPRHVERHVAIHHDFARQVTQMREVSTGKRDTEFLLRFLSSWLSYHILGTDQSMARQVRAIRAGQTPAEAYAQEKSIVADPATASLLEALNSLYRVIAGRNDALVELNSHLEGLVAERTEALSSTNRQLQNDQRDLKAAMVSLEVAQRKLLESEHKRADEKQRHLQQLLAQIIDGDPVPTMVINAEHKVTHWNKACAAVTGVAAAEVVGSNRQWAPFYPQERPIMADLIVSGSFDEGLENFYKGKFRRSELIEGAIEAEDFYPHFGERGRWLFFTAAPLRNAAGEVIGAIETLQDVTERHRAEDELRQYQAQLEGLVEQRTAQLAVANQNLEQDIRQREAAEAELRRRNAELTEVNRKLSQAQEQLLQSEKLASIGQLAAGVAHEINNPIGYVFSNLGTLEKYLGDLFRMIAAYRQLEEAGLADAAQAAELKNLRQKLDLDFLMEDIPVLMAESQEGIGRVKKIVQDLKDFSRVDTVQQWQLADLHQGLDSTINIVANEIKYKADVVKEYGQLPEVECLPSQLNQVFMNLLVNAAQAMGDERGRITIRSGVAGDQVWLEFADNGSGIPADIQAKIFDPFFTTKPVGKGTGLGLSLAYGIIQNHLGRLEVRSKVGEGSTFRITLPIRHVVGGEA